MKVVILAGGAGTRLPKNFRGSNQPKPMVDIGGKPLLERQIAHFREQGFSDFLITVHHQSEPILKWFGRGARHGVQIEYFRELRPMGTAGALPFLRDRLKSDFIVSYGDVLFDMDVKRLVAFHQESKALGTLVIHPNDHPYDSDLVEVDAQERVTAIHRKHKERTGDFANLVNAAFYVLSPEVLDHLVEGEAVDFAQDLFPKLVSTQRLFGYSTAEYLKDVGTPERLKVARADWDEGKVRRWNRTQPRPAVFLDRDGVVNEEVGNLFHRDSLKLIPGSARAIQRLNRSDYVCVVVTNQAVIAKNLCDLAELKAIHNRMETLLGAEGAKVDAIYYCPHHPDKGFPDEREEYKIECDCRKPNTGMIDDACERFNLDRTRSFFIGDRPTDIQCAENAGVTSIGVRTGFGCRRDDCQPDFMVEDLSEATDLILRDLPRQSVESILTAYQAFCEAHEEDDFPFVVAVAGHARSGKSSFCRFLQKRLGQMSVSSEILSLDSWVLPSEERSSEMGVLERYQLPKLVADLRGLLLGKSIDLVPYRAFSRTRAKVSEPRALKGAKVLLLDGIVSFRLPESLVDLRVYCELSPETHRERFHRFYRWKGLSEGDIHQLYETRQRDEWPLIESDRARADVRVDESPSPNFSPTS